MTCVLQWACLRSLGCQVADSAAVCIPYHCLHVIQTTLSHAIAAFLASANFKCLNPAGVETIQVHTGPCVKPEENAFVRSGTVCQSMSESKFMSPVKSWGETPDVLDSVHGNNHTQTPMATLGYLDCNRTITSFMDTSRRVPPPPLRKAALTAALCFSCESLWFLSCASPARFDNFNRRID